MKTKLPKHDVYTLSDGRVVVYLQGKFAALRSLRALYNAYEDKAVAWVVTPRNWDTFTKDFFRNSGLETIVDRGSGDYNDIPVYRGKLKTRIKQLEEEIKHEEHMKTHAAFDPMNTITLDEETFNKIRPETEAIFNVDKGYIAGGNPHSLTPDELTKKVEHLMGDPGFKITYDSTENEKAFQRGFRLGILPSTALVIIYIVKLLINLL